MKPNYEDEDVTLFHGDCREVMATLPAESVSCMMTSPPFWGLRSYKCEPTIWGGGLGHDEPHEWGEGIERQDERYTGRRRWQHIGEEAQAAGTKVRDLDPNAWGHPKVADTATCSLCGAWRGQLGLEPTVQLYIEHTMEWLRACKRVLRKDGVLWLDIDDSRGDMPKSLCLIPQRIAIAAQDDGWIVRSWIIIPSWMPESAKDRPTDAYRSVLMLIKNKRYWYDGQAVRVEGAENIGWEDSHERKSFSGDGSGELIQAHEGLRFGEGKEPDGLRNLGNVWDDIPPAAYPDAHFATFAAEEPERCIKASCPAEICVKCGKARVRVVTRRGPTTTQVNREMPALSGRAYQEGIGQNLDYRGPHTQTVQDVETLGWTDCGCGAGFEAGTVLDPFIGTGTTAIAARKLNRKCIGIDGSEEYLQQAVTRLTVGDSGVRRIVEARRAGAEQGMLL